MDKETLSNYGWIVICVLVLAVMIALAGPFGTFVAGAVKSTTAGLFGVNQNALGAAGIEIGDQVFENCDHLETEVRNVSDTYTGDTCCKACGAVLQAGQTVRAKVPEGGKYTAADGTVYGPGEELPEIVTTGDKYTYGDYEYGYNMYSTGSLSWKTSESQNGWGVDTIVNNSTMYGEILSNINGQPITSLYHTFSDCTKFTVAPVIPGTVTNMGYTFNNCSSLANISNVIIPMGVTSLDRTFAGCTSLLDVSNLIIPVTITDMTCTFANTGLTNEGLPNVPNNVKIMLGTFQYCNSITDVSGFVIPHGTTNIKNLFYSCKSLTKLPVIPDDVTDITHMFSYCTALTDISDFIIPSSVRVMSDTFRGCTSMTVAPVIPETVTSMSWAFRDCTSLIVKPTIPSSVTTTESGIFYGCTQFGY